MKLVTNFENCMVRLKFLSIKLVDGLDNVVAFSVLDIWQQNLVSMKNLCLQITAEVSKITKIAQCDLTFIFINFSKNH